jgi:hypothetical protein
MIGDCLSGLGSYQLRFFLDTAYNTLSGHLKVNNRDMLFAAPSCYDCSLVAYILDVGPTKARSQCCQSTSILIQLNIFVKNQRLQVHLEDLRPAFQIRQFNIDQAIKPTRPGESWVKHFFLVGGSKDDNIGAIIEAIHFHKQLIESCITLVITTKTAC